MDSTYTHTHTNIMANLTSNGNEEAGILTQRW